MSLTVSRRKAFFSIQRLAAMPKAAIGDVSDPVIEIYVVLKGGVTVINKESRISLQNKNLYWACSDKCQRLKVDKGTEGYVLRFSKTLLHDESQELYCTFIAAFCPWPQMGERIQVEDGFFDEYKGLCEMMHKEFVGESDFKMGVIGSLLGIFLLNLIRRSDIVMYVTGNEETRHRSAEMRYHPLKQTS
jgi:AraC family transcriptional activator of pobA